MKLPFTSKKDEKAMDRQHETAMAERARPDSDAYQEKYVSSLGRSVYTIIDPEVIQIITDEKYKLRALIPLLSHLNRLTQIGKDDVVIDRIKIRRMFLRIRITMKKSDYSVELSELLKSLEFFALHMTADSYEGFKAKLLAYEMKIIRTELEEKKTKGML